MIETATPNQHFSFSKENTKTVNKKNSLQLVYIQRNVQVLSILDLFFFFHNKCTFVPTKHNMPEPTATGDSWSWLCKKRKSYPN